jgi:hypothetical protein
LDVLSIRDKAALLFRVRVGCSFLPSRFYSVGLIRHYPFAFVRWAFKCLFVSAIHHEAFAAFVIKKGFGGASVGGIHREGVGLQPTSPSLIRETSSSCGSCSSFCDGYPTRLSSVSISFRSCRPSYLIFRHGSFVGVFGSCRSVALVGILVDPF